MTAAMRIGLGFVVAMCLVSSAAQAAPLTVVNVGAPSVNCVFNTTCKVTVTDSVGDIVLPGTADKGRLQSRTYVGAAGAPGAGKTAYEYRVDLTQVKSLTAVPCVTSLKLDFGPVTKLNYDKVGPLDDVFVVTSGGLGTIGLSGADKVGNVITFTFASPICGGSGGPAGGQTSFFFGLAAATAPKAITAQVSVTPGGGLVNVPARVPTH